MVHNRSYFQLFISIIFVIIAVYGVTYGIRWYSMTYTNKFDNTSNSINERLDNSEINNSGAIDSYKKMHDDANSVNKILLTLFFLALIIFLIFWLIIMIRRSILQ